MVSHQVFRARHVRKTGTGGEVRRGVTSGVSCETSKTWHVTPYLHREQGPRGGGAASKGPHTINRQARPLRLGQGLCTFVADLRAVQIDIRQRRVDLQRLGQGLLTNEIGTPDPN